MKRKSIFATISSIQHLPLRQQRDRLVAWISNAPKRSIERREFEAALSRVVLRDMRAGNRGLNRKGAA